MTVELKCGEGWTPLGEEEGTAGGWRGSAASTKLCLSGVQRASHGPPRPLSDPERAHHSTSHPTGPSDAHLEASPVMSHVRIGSFSAKRRAKSCRFVVRTVPSIERPAPPSERPQISTSRSGVLKNRRIGPIGDARASTARRRLAQKQSTRGAPHHQR